MQTSSTKAPASTQGAPPSASRAPTPTPNPLKRELRGMGFDEGERTLSPGGGAGKPGGQGGGAPLPEKTRLQMERSFCADFKAVRVHQGGEANALGAEAYAQGEHLFFAAGKYAPGTRAGDALIGHELSHVIQQRAGRVSKGPQGKGVALNADKGLEAEADRAGERAARGEAAGIGGGGGTASDPNAPIQGNFGFELEIPSDDAWRVTWDEQGGEMPQRGSKETEPEEKASLPPKGFAIATAPGLQLQAEDSGSERTMEMVTNAPGLPDRGAVEAAANGATEIGQRLATRMNQPSFNASEVGGTPLVRMTPGKRVGGMLQVTAGVPLASIPAILERMDQGRGAKNLGGTFGEKHFVGQSRDSIGDLNHIVEGKASYELQGFLALLRQYLQYGRQGGTFDRTGGRKERTLVKGQFGLMARTDFKTMFGMLPDDEQCMLKLKMDQWIDLVTQDLERTEPITRSIVSYERTYEDTGLSLMTTREEWLNDMPERDRFSLHGATMDDIGRPEYGERGNSETARIRSLEGDEGEELARQIHALYEGIGGYGDKTDYVQYKDKKAPTGAALFELRGLPEIGNPSLFKSGIMNVFDLVDEAVQHTTGLEQGKKSPYENVQSGKQKTLAKEGPIVERQIQAERLSRHLSVMIATASRSKGKHTLDVSGPNHDRERKGFFKGLRKRRDQRRYARNFARAQQRIGDDE